tara:strand:+ start:3867 stop:4034 length:168 start_codon:yes stop_codon:yes gene_type:complete
MKTRQPDYSSVFMGGVDTRDYPDLCESFIEEMDWDDGTPMTESVRIFILNQTKKP